MDPVRISDVNTPDGLARVLNALIARNNEIDDYNKLVEEHNDEITEE